MLFAVIGSSAGKSELRSWPSIRGTKHSWTSSSTAARLSERVRSLIRAEVTWPSSGLAPPPKLAAGRSACSVARELECHHDAILRSRAGGGIALRRLTKGQERVGAAVSLSTVPKVYITFPMCQTGR
jgi:hypothetical protein